MYDTGQQDATLRWLLLKEVGQHMTYRTSMGMWLVRTWHHTSIIWQQGFWLQWGDVTIFMSIIMFSLQGLYDGGVRRQQEL